MRSTLLILRWFTIIILGRHVCSMREWNTESIRMFFGLQKRVVSASASSKIMKNRCDGQLENIKLPGEVSGSLYGILGILFGAELEHFVSSTFSLFVHRFEIVFFHPVSIELRVTMSHCSIIGAPCTGIYTSVFYIGRCGYVWYQHYPCGSCTSSRNPWSKLFNRLCPSSIWKIFSMSFYDIS